MSEASAVALQHENEIAPVQTPSSVSRKVTVLDMTAQQFERIQILAGWYADSNFASNGAKTAQEFGIIMLKGLELGISPMAAVDMISIINGVPVLDAKGMLALIQGSDLLEDMQIEATEQVCKVTMTRRGQQPHTETFSMKDASRMSLTGKRNWKQQPRTMLKWRAVTACSRVVFSDVIGGLYTPEEIAPDETQVADDGSMVVYRPENVRQLPDVSVQENGAGQPDREPQSGETELVKVVDVRTYTRKNGTEKQYLVLDGVSIWSKEPFRQLGYLPTEIEMLKKVGKHELPDPVIIKWERNDRGYKDAVTITRPKTGEIVNVAEVYEAAKQRQDDKEKMANIRAHEIAGGDGRRKHTPDNEADNEPVTPDDKSKAEIEDDIPF